MDRPFESGKYWSERIRSLETTPLQLWPPARGEKSVPIEVELGGPDAERLEQLTRGAPLLRHAAIVGAVQAALALHTRTSEVVIATPPRIQGDEPTAPNILTIVQSIAPDTMFQSLLTSVRRSLLDAFALQNFSCLQLFQELHPDVMPVRVAVSLEGFNGPLALVPELTIEARVGADHVRLCLDGHGRFASDAVRTFGEHIACVLAAGSRTPAITIQAIPFLSVEEHQRICFDWNTTDAPSPTESVITSFERQAARRPEAVALSGEYSLTYGELNARANKLARLLRARGVGPEVRVAVLLRRSRDTITSLLAILKAGGVYIPLDPAYPRERLEHMLADASPHIVLTEAFATADLAPHSARLVMIEETEGPLAAADFENETPPINMDQLAYVIYTSGSTGDPRGVMVSHGSLANAIHYFAQRCGVDENSHVSQMSSFSFDASALECYLALTTGAALCIAPSVSRSSASVLSAFLRQQRITVIGAITPALLQLMEPEDGATVRAINIGAEKCPADLADRWATGRLLLNCYGPTEATIDCVCGPCAVGEGDPPLGRPITNTKVYVLDPQMQPQPIGVVGELYVGGVAVARGYERRPGDTARAFVPDPFTGSGARLYRTGDLARFRADGRLDFCGRGDRQVKIDGLRIELGDVEAALARHAGIAQVVVDVQSESKRGLVAYFVPANRSAPSVRELRDHLSAILPSSMIPSAFVELPELPITPNGKINRRVLSEVTAAPVTLCDQVDEPQTTIEQKLAEIYREVLRIEKVGRDDNFFELGGRSLDVTRVMAKVAKVFSVELSLETMFNTPTLAGLAAAIAASLDGAQSSPEAIPLFPLLERPAGGLPLSFSQQRLWFLNKILPADSSALYNGPVPVRLQGKLNPQALIRSFNEIIRRHEVLRTAFRTVNREPVQVVLPHLKLKIESIDLRAYKVAERIAMVDELAAADAKRPFDLTQPPLLRASLIILDEDDHVLLLNIHHIVFDGWSVGVLLKELSQFYVAFMQGEPAALPPLPLQYADFALWQRRWLAGARLEKQLGYWRRQLADLPTLELPTDAEPPKLPTYRGAVESFTIPAEVTAKLKRLSAENDVTLFMTLLAGFSALLHRYTLQEDMVISSPVANRRQTELEGLIGFFVNSLVLRIDISQNPTFRQLLQRVRRVTLEAYDHQDTPFERLVEELRPQRVATHNPLFRAAFSLQNTLAPPEPPPGIVVTTWETHNRTAKFDLVVALTESDEVLLGDMEYSSDLFKRTNIRDIIQHYSRLLERVVADPDCTVLKIPLIEERFKAATGVIAHEAFKF